MNQAGGYHRKRRLAGAAGAIVLLAAIGAPNALAGTGLGPSLQQVTQSAVPAPAPVPAVDVTPPAVAPVVETATTVAEPATTVAEPVLSAAEPVVKSAPVAEAEKTVAPVVEPVKKVAETSTETIVTTSSKALNDPGGTVTNVVNDPVGTVTNVVNDPVGTVQETTKGTLESVTTKSGSLANGPGLSNMLGNAVGALGEAVRAAGAAGVAPAGTAFVDAPTTFVPPTRPAIKDSAAREDTPAPAITLSSAPTNDAAHSTPAAGAAMPSSQPHAPLPEIPSGPLTALFSASASAGGGALALLLAALAAATLLAAPGVGRRLRPTLAFWPQPIPHLSLERPG